MSMRNVNAAWLKWWSITSVLWTDALGPNQVKHLSNRRPACHTVRRRVRANYEGRRPPTCYYGDQDAALDARGITGLNRVPNVDIRAQYSVAEISEKARECRMRLYGHAFRAGADSIIHMGLHLDVPGSRPRQRWLDTLHHDLRAVGLHPDQAHDRAKWRFRIKSRCADSAAKRD
ncbi:uncharacterized protein LOC111625741 [Centruroides sculpturatus]|uniref:uncharacterized protein LOC111625741 n=1 Tax=Centruroides sculpturatus TaxID=218467 RepID=UPI000C6EE57B|nr:uncharacterized protein LOC111625741 [Centruroides sculpturatus]